MAAGVVSILGGLLRLILGLSVSLGEQELHWLDFLQGLVERGLNAVELIISDAHLGLQAVAKRFSAVSPGSAASSICSRTPASICLG
jgi:transposase-like protein